MATCLKFELTNLCRRNRDGSHATQAGRLQVLRQVADELKALGFGRMGARSLKPKHVDALVQRWQAEGLAMPRHVVLPAAGLEPATAAWRDRLVVLGGFGPTLAIAATRDELDPATGVWTRGPDAPVAWTHAQLAAVGDRLVLAGGLAGTGFVARGEVFVDAGATRRRRRRRPTPTPAPRCRPRPRPARAAPGWR